MQCNRSEPLNTPPPHPTRAATWASAPSLGSCQSPRCRSVAARPNRPRSSRRSRCYRPRLGPNRTRCAARLDGRAGHVPGKLERRLAGRIRLGGRGLLYPRLPGAPAFDRTVHPHPATVGSPCTDGVELPPGRRGLTILILAPAFDRTVVPHPAGVLKPCADGGELPHGRCGFTRVIAAPAFDRTVVPHPAGVVGPCADGVELPPGWRGQTGAIGAPALDRTVRSHPAGVVQPCADGEELTAWRRGLTVVIPAPAFDRTVVPHPATVGSPCTDGEELTARRRGLTNVVVLPVVIAAPALDRTVVPHPAGVPPPPALTDANCPPGGVDWPSSFQPQHWTVPSTLTPQVRSYPALTERN